MKKLITLAACAAVCGLFAGCFTSATARTKKTLPDGTVTESYVGIVGTGDKASQVAAEGLFADGTDEDLGSGVKNAKASQESSGIEGTLNGLGGLMTGMANFMAATQGVKTTQAVQPTPVAESSGEFESVGTSALISKPDTLPAETVAANATVLAYKMAEAKSSGKPLVVIAGNVGCGYCTKLDKLLDADAAFLARKDIILYRETSPWATNQAGKWTGGGNLPVLRVTQWDSSGQVVCDKKVNRPKSIAEIESSLNTCSVSK